MIDINHPQLYMLVYNRILSPTHDVKGLQSVGWNIFVLVEENYNN